MSLTVVLLVESIAVLESYYLATLFLAAYFFFLFYVEI